MLMFSKTANLPGDLINIKNDMETITDENNRLKGTAG